MDFRRSKIDLVGRQNLWFSISLALMLIGAVSLASFGLNLGIDYRGGTQLQYRIPPAQRPQSGQEAAFVGQVREKLAKAGLRSTQLRVIGGDTLAVSTPALTTEDRTRDQNVIQTALAPTLGQNARPLASDFVGAVIGEELRRNAVVGVLLGVSLIAVWICLRYSFNGFRDGVRYAVGGVVALVHDVFVLVGLFALIGHFFPRVEIEGSFIAALLTVVGYSINDSVVIFDRIRENLRARRRDPFLTVVNDSLLETMSRSINTGITVLIMLLALLLFGGESIFNFVLAMLLGIASGLYSSIFNASMVLCAWHRWDEKKARAAREARGVSAPTRSAPTRLGNAPQPATAGATRGTTRAVAAPPRSVTPTVAPRERVELAKPSTPSEPAASEPALSEMLTPDNAASEVRIVTASDGDTPLVTVVNGNAPDADTPGVDETPLEGETPAQTETRVSKEKAEVARRERVSNKARSRRRH